MEEVAKGDNSINPTFCDEDHLVSLPPTTLASDTSMLSLGKGERTR